MVEPEDNITVRYSAKELFGRIDMKLDVIASTLSTKADHESLVALEKRVTLLESSNGERLAISGWLKAAVVMTVPVLALGVTAIVAYWPG